MVLGGADLGGGGDLTGGGAGLIDLPLPAGVPGISVSLHSGKEIVLEETEGQVWLQVLVGAQLFLAPWHCCSIFREKGMGGGKGERKEEEGSAAAISQFCCIFVSVGEFQNI